MVGWVGDPPWGSPPNPAVHLECHPSPTAFPPPSSLGLSLPHTTVPLHGCYLLNVIPTTETALSRSDCYIQRSAQAAPSSCWAADTVATPWASAFLPGFQPFLSGSLPPQLLSPLCDSLTSQAWGAHQASNSLCLPLALDCIQSHYSNTIERQ